MFEKVIAMVKPYSMLPLRLGVGLIPMVHAWPQLRDTSAFVDVVDQTQLPYSQILAYLAIAVQMIGGAFVIVGFQTRLSAFALSIVMGTAIYEVHWGEFYPGAPYELPALVLLGAFSLFLAGSGKASVDSFRGKA